MLKKIFVIGSNSFTGNKFINYSLDKNIKIIGVSRSKEPSEVLLSYKKNKNISNFSFFKLNVNNEMKKIISLIESFKPDAIVNYSAQGDVRHSWENPIQWFNTNSSAIVELSNRLVKMKFLKKYISISTPEVYGSSKKKLKETNFYNPSTPYAVSKLSGDLHLLTLFKKYNFPVIFTRSSNVYGPNQHLYRIIPKTIINLKLGKKIELHGKGRSIRDFIYIDDVNKAVFKLINKGKNGEVYNIATNEKMISIYDLVKKISNIMNVDFYKAIKLSEENYGQDQIYNLDSNKIRKSINWSENYMLEHGIRETISWVESNWSKIIRMPHNYVHKK
jgi:dTDP-glucose 4,6-dehydratase